MLWIGIYYTQCAEARCAAQAARAVESKSFMRKMEGETSQRYLYGLASLGYL